MRPAKRGCMGWMLGLVVAFAATVDSATASESGMEKARAEQTGAEQSVAEDAKSSQRPNILLIYLDDFGWRDCGFAGSDFYETPHLDRLAAQGMVFSDAYSCASNCAPARACLLSGLYTPRHQIFNVGTRPRGKAEHRRLKHVAGTDTLDEKFVTWAERLRKVGYRTASMGKWHLSDDPTRHGFDINIGGSHSGGPPRGYYPPHPNVPGLADAPEGEYLTDRLSDEAIRFIEDSRERPWCLYLTHFAVHTPLDEKVELAAKYQAKNPGILHDNWKMATMIQAVDDGVGRIMETLKANGLSENTVVMLYSDNGGFGPATDMAPLKGYKGTYYEGGIRVPLVVKWPAVVTAGSRCDVPVTGVDMYPTLCEIAGAELPADAMLDGASWLPLLRGEASEFPERAVYWHFPAYLQSYRVWDEQRDPLFRSRPCSVIRRGDWKLHQYFEDGGLELYNLREDISESRNLVHDRPDVVRELLSELKAWQESVDAPIPTEPNPRFDAEAERKAIAAANRQQPPK